MSQSIGQEKKAKIENKKAQKEQKRLEKIKLKEQKREKRAILARVSTEN